MKYTDINKAISKTEKLIGLHEESLDKLNILLRTLLESKRKGVVPENLKVHLESRQLEFNFE